MSVGAGLAIGAKIDKFATLVYVLLGGGKLAEGSAWEVAKLLDAYGISARHIVETVRSIS